MTPSTTTSSRSTTHHHFPMERVLYNLHHKCCTFVLQTTSRRSRSWAEHSILVIAVCAFGALLLAHLTFVHRPGMMRNTTTVTLPTTCLSSIPGFVKGTDLTHLTLIDDNSPSRTSSSPPRKRLPNDESLASCGAERILGEVDTDHVCDVASPSLGSSLEEDDKILFSYSREKGYLLLSPDLCERHGIGVQYVQVSKSDARCFGEPFLQTLVFSLLGPDTVMINWLLGTYDTVGYIYNPRTRVMTDLFSQYHHESNINSSSGLAQWAVVRKVEELLVKFTVVIKTSFLFFITTTLVSFTLRETQGRMLDFTHHLQEYVRANRPVVNLVTTHVVENLVFVPIMVGMIFFLIEFYRGDKFLAFMVLSLVWVCESFSVVSLRTKQGVHFFPRIFFLLFELFHFYHISFPWGFSYTALATSMCFMLHSMLFFWHRYELPAVVLGRVSPEHPRQRVSTSPESTPSERSDSGRNTPEHTVPTYINPTQGNFGRSLSFNTAASGRMSRQSSTNGMFHQGDDDDDGSYMFFMGGEVVMHRNEPRPPSPGTPTNEYMARDPGTATSEGRRNRRERFVNELETLVASAVSTDDDSEQIRTPQASSSSADGLSGNTSSQSEQPTDNYLEDNETSALQAILNVMNEESSLRGTSPTNASDPDDPSDPLLLPSVPIFR